ncbi:hypothetical protein A3742_14040 [Oleiphilus sp. HI0071]|uniref:hypothetical protein n=1 Tax=unclassified Oleiphilus TaxID=2631174 RepID=UPI0007C387C5|nr:MULTISPECIES: hypothetical protein [unclassified Oleiphilus]KZY74646.1 hypothetical protein A3737_08815 [Oleiphilus sp. HI0065]KZY79410.1 hypothetical protein A3742_14040 [Oleiphilus sp. HI0071]KZZ05546.1 hypothetical protein A3744_08160 [Oleiphilus sp. HI0073]KZZ51168.1 hypothetical protein A3760_01110 [Oleiphilus sp. HI0122]KZZ52607.1 hypothetical protein A3758_11525 [Oleiphilus sp. HI0118]KZZ69379.1 hypothetical protein A3765_03630 [Oleiphilus sp. HI0130]KZZ74870.1 hypothetical protein
MSKTKQLALLLVGFIWVACAQANYKLPSGEVLQDPTRPLGLPKAQAKAKPEISYRLSYILRAENRNLAIVNGKKVAVGDVVSGAKVVAISSDSVTLSVKGKKRVLAMRMPSKDIKINR